MLDESLFHDLRDQQLREAYIEDFFVVLALCNTVVLSRKSHIQDGQCLIHSHTCMIELQYIYI